MADATTIATLHATARVWAVGAIHGEAPRLVRLHDLLWQKLARGDRIVYLGNHLGRGPDVRGTVDELIRFRREAIARRGWFAADVVHLRGAQEEMWHKLLQLQLAPNPREVLRWMLAQGVGTTIEAYGGRLAEGEAAARDGVRALTRWTQALRQGVNASPGHIALFSSLRHAAATHDGALLMVSADIAPERPLAAQGDVLWWGAGGGIDALDAPFAGHRLVIAGYDRRGRGARVGKFSCVIDGGAGRGGSLVATCFDVAGQRVDQIEV